MTTSSTNITPPRIAAARETASSIRPNGPNTRAFAAGTPGIVSCKRCSRKSSLACRDEFAFVSYFPLFFAIKARAASSNCLPLAPFAVTSATH